MGNLVFCFITGIDKADDGEEDEEDDSPVEGLPIVKKNHLHSLHFWRK